MTLLLVALSTTLAAAPGETPADPSAAAREAATSAFGEGDFDGCLRKLDAALRLTQEDQPLAEIYLMQGRCLAALRRFGPVEESFTHALEHDPEAKLDASRVLPTLVVLLDELRQRLHGSIEIDTQPAGAQVWLDGAAMGPAPIRRTAALGRHKVQARGPAGTAPAQDEAIVRPNQTTRLLLNLNKPEPPRPIPVVTEESDDGIHFDLDAATTLDPVNGFALALGPCVSGKYAYATARVAYGVAPAGELELGLRIPRLLGPVGIAAGGQAAGVFFSSGTAWGVGGFGGLWVTVSPRLEIFAEGGARQYLVGPPQSGVGILSAGARIHLM